MVRKLSRDAHGELMVKKRVFVQGVKMVMRVVAVTGTTLGNR